MANEVATTTDVRLRLSKSQLHRFFREACENMEDRPLNYSELYTFQMILSGTSAVLKVWEHSGEVPSGKTLVKMETFHHEQD